ncbi:MAG: phosphatidate cytidylyltransferase [Nitrospirota bacterium]
MVNTRVLTSLVLVPLLFVVVWLLPPVYFAGLAIIAAAIGQYELYAMARGRGITPLMILGIVLGALIVLTVYRPIPPYRGGPFFWITLCVLAVITARLFSRRPVEGALEDITVTMFGIVYVALLFAFQVAILAGSSGKRWLMFLYLVIWASDIGAYYVGTAFGKRRLYERISPKKSIEGLIGGTLASIIIAVLCKIWLVPALGWVEASVLGAVLALVGTVGDLAESLIKRSTGVKDSGTIIPGHGGILDRMDSMLFAAPVLFFYMRMR